VTGERAPGATRWGRLSSLTARNPPSYTVKMDLRRCLCVIGLAAFAAGVACSSSNSGPGTGSGSGGSPGSGGKTGGSGGGTGSGGSGSGGSVTNGSGGGGGTTVIDAPIGGDDASDVVMPAGDASASMRRHGMSAGCGKPPGAVGAQKVTIPTCTNCSAKMGNCPRDCVAPEFAPGGPSSRAAGGQDFTSRNFTIALPGNYQNNMAYPLFLGGGGCGSVGAGYAPPGANAGITVNLAILAVQGPQDGGCFADGGIACSAAAANIPWCVNAPEMPYVRGILKWVESNFCVDLDKEFIGGSSSGAWEAITNACGDADQLRGFVSIAGGKREHRWPCNGPMAAFMIADTGDGGNPIGPLPQLSTPSLDSYGSAPERDDLLTRNGCQGKTGTMYDPKYPKCLKYDCPAAYPVVWCALAGGHTNTTDGGVNYQAAIWPFFMSLPPPP